LPRLDSVGFLADVPPPPPLSGLSRAELEALLVELVGKVAALGKVVGEQREEIARLKGLKGRPTIKPSGVDEATEPAKPDRKEQQQFRGKVTPRVKVKDQVVKVAVPEGSRFKGHEPFLAQNLVISVSATRYQRERWVTPDGRSILAPLPEGGWAAKRGPTGHFGPELRRFVLTQYHQGQSTKHSLSAPLIAGLRAEPQTCFADQATWLAHLDRLGFTTLDVTPNPRGSPPRAPCGAAFSRTSFSVRPWC
jgi:hypothetical protein